MNEKFGEIMITDDYGMFNFKKENRRINFKKVEKLVRDIEAKGKQYQPIVVNENYEIYDGQHRYEALKVLRMPIKYFIEKDLDVEDIVKINNSQTKWGLDDYLHLYSENGNKTYKILEELREEYGFSLKVILFIINGAIVRENKVKEGKFEIDDEKVDSVKEKLDWLRILRGALPQRITQENIFLITALRAYSLENIDKKRLYESIVKNYGRKEFKYGNQRECIQVISDMYDLGRTNKSFIYSDIMKKMYNEHYTKL